jgi:hypothetical protein
MQKKGGEQKFGYTTQTVLDAIVGSPGKADWNKLQRQYDEVDNQLMQNYDK